ncbi:NUDIX domain-containing protein [Candidatus Fermentibacteria bacterium]|nr:NUDIX domain-containing protein [Candidatus Fermentibacteria bacterium]
MRPRTPELTVDAIIELDDGKVVLVERKNFPPGWAIPGGFVDPGETLAEAVRREALEETSLRIDVREIFHVYSQPSRDPRGHTVSVVYHCTASGEPEGGDDARTARAFSPDSLPEDIAFDHDKVLSQFFSWKKTGRKPSVEE